MTTRSYDVNDDVTESVEFEASSVDTDPTTVKFRVQKPDGTERTYLYGTDIEVVKTATGKYTITLNPDTPGLYHFRWEGTGNLDAFFDGAFNVLTDFTPISARFCTIAEVASYLRLDLDVGDPFVLVCIEGATEAVQRYCRQQFVLVTDDTVIVDGSGSDTLLLPETPVLDVSEVIFDVDLDGSRILQGPSFGSNAEYDFTLESGLLVKRRGEFVLFEDRFNASFGTWPLRRRSVQVTYTHGYAVIPPAVKMVALVAAARGVSQDGAEQERTGAYLARYAGQPAELTAGEKRVLDQFRTRKS